MCKTQEKEERIILLKNWGKFCATGAWSGRWGRVRGELESWQVPAARLTSCASIPEALGSHGKGGVRFGLQKDPSVYGGEGG